MQDSLGYVAQVLRLISADAFVRATFGGPPRFQKNPPLQRAVVRRVMLAGGGGPRLQVSRFDGRKDRSSNYSLADAAKATEDILEVGFANVHVVMAEEEIDLRLTKNGDVLTGRRPAKPRKRDEPHDRAKDVAIPEGRADVLLEAMGILDRNYRVRPTMRAKFTQINEFLKLLEHVLGEVEGRPLRILDCGCGASHLTLAVHHYLNTIKGIPATVLGIDLNEEVIQSARERAAMLGSTGIEFRVGPIGEPQDVRPDIVLALHACDTATDDAISQAIRSEARLLLAVPCCHRFLNERLKVAALAPIHRHGILHQREADLITDAFRALILRVMGYRTEVIEFISREHTARNLMIRAVRSAKAHEAVFVKEYAAFKAFTGVTPYLETVLGDLLSATRSAEPLPPPGAPPRETSPK